jgi:hypothetical protein
MYDVIVDALNNLYIPVKAQPSFMEDIYPLLQQLSMNQWVNQGFYVAYGYQQPYDFTDLELLRRLSTVTKNRQGKTTDDYREYRRQIFNYFRSPTSPQIEPQRWPWMYGDNMAVPATTANGYLALTTTLYGYLQKWMEGDFGQDWKPDGTRRLHSKPSRTRSGRPTCSPGRRSGIASAGRSIQGAR